jgi:hypothetical protein
MKTSEFASLRSINHGSNKRTGITRVPRALQPQDRRLPLNFLNGVINWMMRFVAAKGIPGHQLTAPQLNPHFYTHLSGLEAEYLEYSHSETLEVRFN